MTRARAAALLLALAGCAPAAGPFVLQPSHGRVVDADTGEPIAGATVIEWYRGARAMGGPQPSYHARFAATDPAGRFRFERELAPSLRMWALRTYGPTYGFYHASYGLETASPRRPAPAGADAGAGAAAGGAGAGTGLVLEGSLRRAHLGLEAVRAYCDGRREEDAATARLRALACPLAAHAAWPDGTPRAVGESDGRGRRTGPWTFHYEGGGVAARGAYQAGGAAGRWVFFDRDGNRVD